MQNERQSDRLQGRASAIDYQGSPKEKDRNIKHGDLSISYTALTMTIHHNTRQREKGCRYVKNSLPFGYCPPPSMA